MLDRTVLNRESEKIIKCVNINVPLGETDLNEVIECINRLHRSIPDAKKKSFGIVSVLVALSQHLYELLGASDNPFAVGKVLFESDKDYRIVSLGLGILSHVGVTHPEVILPYFELAADHPTWEVKEFAQMYIRKITKANKERVQTFLIGLAQSDNPSLRRFSSESLRPVVENKWIHDMPEYSLVVLRYLYKETDDFPKVSVGNNLSDLSRKNPELVLSIVRELKSYNDKNSDFIAHRACRNLVKTHSEVFDILGIETYRYKDKIYHRLGV